MAYRDPEVRRARDRERIARRTAERIARGLCPRCGKRSPAPERSVCDPCGEKRNRASRARDARLRAEGKPRRDPEKARTSDRARDRRQRAKRRAQGLCTKCGKVSSKPDSCLCEPCGEKRRAADRARYVAAKAAGKLYGGRDPEAKRRSARAGSRKRDRARRDAGLCTRCGHHPSVEGGTTCEPCRKARQATERERYAARRAAGLCVACGGTVLDGAARCGPCAVLEEERRSPERKNAAARRRYAERRALGKCTDCGGPAFGACRCPECAKRSYERSDHFRGMPVYPPSFAVFLRETDECLATFDDEMETIAWLAFEKLDRDAVEIVRDASPLATLAAWE